IPTRNDTVIVRSHYNRTNSADRSLELNQEGIIERTPHFRLTRPRIQSSSKDNPPFATSAAADMDAQVQEGGEHPPCHLAPRDRLVQSWTAQKMNFRANWSIRGSPAEVI